MHNIGLIYDGSDAENWYKYLDGILDVSDRVRLTKGSLNVVDDDASNEESLSKFVKESLVLVLLLSPGMCETLEEQPAKYSKCLSEHSSVVVIMCYTEKKDLSEFSKHCETCMSWKMLEIYNSRKENQIMMSEIVEMVDNLKKKHRPPPRPKPRQHKVKVIPDSVHKIKEPVTVIFQEETIGTVQIGFSNTDTLYDTEKLNPYTYQFRAPARDFGLAKLKIYKDGREVHECPFTYVEPKLAAYQCTDMLAQCLGTSNRDALDVKLVELYEKSFPQDDVLDKMLHATEKPTATKSNSEIPTILHFAAKNGLSELCSIILDTPGSVALFETENVDGSNPADLAELAGFADLADYIRMFIETSYVVEACDEFYLQMNHTHIYSNKDQREDEDLDDYEKFPEMKGLLPKPKSFKYQSKKSLESEEASPSVPPKPPFIGSRPMLPEPTKERPLSEGNDEEDLYAAKESLLRTGPPPIPEKTPSIKALSKSPITRKSPAEFMGMTAPPLPERPSSLHADGKTPLVESKESFDIDDASGSQSQKELIEIAEGVKCGDFSLDDAERLYSAWKSRNTNESTSIKERKKMIEEMQKEYKAVFEASKKKDNAFGRLSILGKIKKWHKRKKSAPEINISKPLGRGKGSRYTKFPGSIPEDKVSSDEPADIHSDPRCSSISNSSSSSAGSRDSRMSITSRESSVSESFETTDSESDEVQERFDSGMDSDGQVRRSMKIEFLESIPNTTSAEPPPIPPRPGRTS